MAVRRDIPFHEWVQEQRRIGEAKANSTPLIKLPGGGQVSSISPPPISPGYGLNGRPAYDRQFSGTPASQSPGQSKYDRPVDQPPSWIDDVDINENWFSPMQPVWPFGPPYVNQPREWDYQTGYNLNFIPGRMNTYSILRAMRSSWGVLAAVVATKQDQLLRVPWTIQRRDKPRASSTAVEEMKTFFKKPDGKLRYGAWANLVLDDLLVLDAPCIYFPRRRDGKPLFAERLDGATIFPLIDDAGRRPDSIVEIGEDGVTYLRRQPAFQQIIKGMPMVDLDETQVMYSPMRPHAEIPVFGYSPCQQILVEVTEAIRKTFYQLNFWTEGTIPDLIVTVPKEWTPRQIAMFQAHFDAMLSGNLQLKSKVRFLPGDMKPFDIKNSSGESLWSSRDEHLIRLVCFAYGVSPAPFVQMMNRSTAQQAQQTSVEEGLFPLMAYWKDAIMDPIIQEKFGYEDVEMVFQPIPEPNGEKQATIHQIQIKTGLRTRDEIRVADLGLEPLDKGGDVPMIEVGNAVIPVVDAAEGKALPAVGGGPDSTQSPREANAAGNQDGRGGNNKTQPTNLPIRGAARPRQDSPTPTAKAASTGEIDESASESRGDVNSISHRQQVAGNYQKGHVRLHGLELSIENAAFSTRGKRNENNEIKWASRMPNAHYGYIRGTVGADGDCVDCYIGRRPDSERVWVIDQTRLSKKGKVKFDEHKVFLGYRSQRRVLKDYRATRDDGLSRVGGIVEMSIGDFKKWLRDGDTTQQISGQGYGAAVGGTIAKSDTISAATGLANNYGTLPSKRRKGKKRRSNGPRWLSLTATA